MNERANQLVGGWHSLVVFVVSSGFFRVGFLRLSCDSRRQAKTEIAAP